VNTEDTEDEDTAVDMEVTDVDMAVGDTAQDSMADSDIQLWLLED